MSPSSSSVRPLGPRGPPSPVRWPAPGSRSPVLGRDRSGALTTQPNSPGELDQPEQEPRYTPAQDPQDHAATCKPSRFNKAQTVGAAGFEPTISPTQTVRDTRLRYAPMAGFYSHSGCMRSMHMPADPTASLTPPLGDARSPPPAKIRRCDRRSYSEAKQPSRRPLYRDAARGVRCREEPEGCGMEESRWAIRRGRQG
jgi:hypothetical protein